MLGFIHSLLDCFHVISHSDGRKIARMRDEGHANENEITTYPGYRLISMEISVCFRYLDRAFVHR